MRIDKLELIGFKSFAERTAFNFHPGITCIVGPNGSGKSNIVDAFRWVLGEQSAKSLRGEKMEEVIFNGSTSKKPRGMAEVTLMISGTEGAQLTSSDDNDEKAADTVSVTRRLYRSGDSEYMLNKSQCRLKDIKDLFLDTGLEVKSYSILEQDRIAQILNAKPLERRVLIEEVAGVMKYNVRKKEALAKLESSRSNLQRVSDIIIEVKKQINFLDRLAKKAEKYKKLTSEIHSIELKLAKRDYTQLRESFQKIISEFNILKEEESLKRAALSTIETETETRRIQLLEKEKLQEQVQNEYQSQEKDIAETEKSIAIAKTEGENFKEYLTKLHQQDEEYMQKEAELQTKQLELGITETDLSSEIDKQKELLQEKAEVVRSLEDEIIESEDLLERKRREIFKVSEMLSNLKNDQARLQSGLENLKHREETSIRDSENLKKVLAELDTSLKDAESNLLEKNNEIMLLREKKAIIDREIITAKGRIETLRETLSRLKEELASFLARIESLKEFILDESVKEFLSGDYNIRLLATLSDIMDIDDDYEKAIESALSEKVNSFILPSYQDIENAVRILKERGLGRTAFIPLNPEVTREEYSDLPEGVIGRASDFITAKEGFSEVARSLFSHVVIVRDLQTALNLTALDHKHLYVTIDGDVIEPSGAVIAGEIKGIFKRKREIRELENAVEQNKNKIEQIQTTLVSAQQLVDEKEADLRTIETTIVDKEKDVSVLKLTAENYREEKERRSRKLAYVALEIEQLTREKASIEKMLGEKEVEIHTADIKRAESETVSKSLQEEISQRRAKLEEHRSEVTEIKMTITSLRERAESVSKEKESISGEIINSSQKKAFLAEEIASVDARIMQRQTDIAMHEEKLKTLVSIADEYSQEISERKEIIDSEKLELLTTEQGLKHLRQEIEALSRKTADLDIQKAEHRLKMDTLAESIRQNYGLAIDIVEVEPLSEEDELKLSELREKIHELGPVNLGTIEEYEELRKRYEFLHNQQEDLIRSIAELEEAIAKINVTTRKKLREAFDVLKAKFSEVFLTLFGGGKAELCMTDENNILETGIDIIAQPPGKRLQNISLLSGGEKALTALSLLFAGFLIKPTPLCILDEADSALDEANTEKFSSMVKELSMGTQFIVVTHNRNTMSVADYIYGITMEEAGVSKVLSMQLVEA